MCKAGPICLLTLLLVAAACEGKYGHRLEGRVDGRIPVPGDVRAIRVELVDGDVTFRAGEAGQISFSGSGMKAADTADQLAAIESQFMGLSTVGVQDGVMLLHGPRVPEAADAEQVTLALRMVVTVPAEVALDVQARSGNLAAIEMRAPVSLQTGVGMLNLSEQRGPGTLRNKEGDIIVDGHRGGLDVETASGKLFAWVHELGPTGVSLVTKFGPIQARLPDDASFRLDAEAEMGKVANEYGIPVVRKDDFLLTMTGSVGDGDGPPVFMRAKDGRISVRRIGRMLENPLPVLLVGLAGVLVLAGALYLYRRLAARQGV